MRGRLRKATQFQDAATTIREFADNEAEVGDAFVMLIVHAGIAAADAICCHELGQHAHGENHNEAVQLIRRVTPDGDPLAKALDTLLSTKTRAATDTSPLPGRPASVATALPSGLWPLLMTDCLAE